MGQPRKPNLNTEELWTYSLRLLSGRSLSSGEVREKLRRRAEEGADLEEVISRLKESGYLNDARFAEGFATARRDFEGFGQFRVMQDLRKRRVAPAVAEKAASEAFSEVDETVQAENYLVRKYRGKNLPVFLAEEKNMASAYRRLRTAGFGSGTAIRVLKRFSKRAEELEDAPEEPAEG